MWENNVRETGPQQVVARATQQNLSDAILGAQHGFYQAALCPLGSNQLLLKNFWEFFLYELSSIGGYSSLYLMMVNPLLLMGNKIMRS